VSALNLLPGPCDVQVNSRFLYDVCLSHALEWPSLTVQMLPTPAGTDSKSQKERTLLLGTHTSGNEQDYVLIVKVVLPGDDEEEEEMQEAATGENWHKEAPAKGPRARVEMVQRINHQGEVNRARYMPQKPSIIATKGPAAEVYVFDQSTQPGKPPTDGSCTPLLKLLGHTKEGYGVSWNPMAAGQLVSAADDATICTWDTEVRLSSHIRASHLVPAAAVGTSLVLLLFQQPMYVRCGGAYDVYDIIWCI